MGKNLITEQLFAFDLSIAKIIQIIEQFTDIHFYLKGLEKEILLFNEKQGRTYGLSEASIGKSYDSFLPPNVSKVVTYNDQLVIHKRTTLAFVETDHFGPGLSIKTPMKNSNNNTVGVCGITFEARDDFCLNTIISVISQLNVGTQITPMGLVVNHTLMKQEFNLLTPREKECIKYLRLRLSSKEVARKLNISYKTVERHIENIKQKLNCRRRYEIFNLLSIQ